MSSESDARRIASGHPPSQLVPAQQDSRATGRHLEDAAPASAPLQADAPFDPLRLCIFATIALLGWLAGPVALVAFSALGFAGYWKARRAGLKNSKCYLRDTRLVLVYLGILTLAGLGGTYAIAARLLGI